MTSLDGINGLSIQTLLTGENDSKQSDDFRLSQGEHLKLTTELSEKVKYPHNQAIKNELNKAILLI